MDSNSLFEEMISDQRNSIKRICSSYERIPEKAQELYQEVLIAIWQSLQSFRGQCSHKTWVYRITYNKAITHVAKECKTSAVRFVSFDEIEDELKTHCPFEKFQNKDILQKVEHIISILKPIDREVFTLFLEGFSHLEIAEVVKVSESLISTKIHQVKKIIYELDKESNRE